ncbi:MAG: hypothetical protein KF752_13500 [Pirellulaceae bacterium]|nr:hypothetical protein [Pirellulaceae bacterium]
MNTMKHSHQNRGLILLVVLGMLTLFSLLAVTYVIYATQSRSTNVAFSRRMARETETRSLLDEAIKQLIRGTTDTGSAMWGQDMLADLYGANETSKLQIGLNPLGDLQVRIPGSALEYPLLLGSDQRFLRIPLVPESIRFPVDIDPDNDRRNKDDIITGRTITFYPDQGPLSGQSFRILRYVGDGTSAPTSGTDSLIASGSQYSITIDLHEADLDRTHSQMFDGKYVSGSVREWIKSNVIAVCYTNAISSNPPPIGYRLFLNAVALNAHGIGITNSGESQDHRLTAGTDAPAEIGRMPVGLQPNVQGLLSSGELALPGFTGIAGDTDEPVDAADFNTMFLSYRAHKAKFSRNIDPSFYRAALIKYITGFKPISSYSEEELWATLRRIEFATLRPLALDIGRSGPIPAYMDSRKIREVGPGIWRYVSHPQFKPSKQGIGVLQVNPGDNWNEKFKDWVEKLTATDDEDQWDVDNTGDGLADSIWMDIGFPLQRTPDGKLLKALVAYYVDDLDGKIDVNAAGGNAQANWYAEAFSSNILDDTVARQSTLLVPTGASQVTVPMAQGFGFGPAEISFRHLLGKSSLVDSNGQPLDGEQAYKAIMLARYSPRTGAANGSPGDKEWEAISKLLHLPGYPNFWDNTDRQLFVSQHRHGGLPGLPIGIRGRESLVLDRLGNPFIHNHSPWVRHENSSSIGIANNEYESRLISGGYADSAFQLSDWERVYRVSDADRALLSTRLQSLFGETDRSIPASNLRHEITVRSRSLLAPKLSHRSREINEPAPMSFYDLVNAIRKFKSSQTGLENIPPAAFRAMFPLEFNRALPMDLNRPFGNGIDDNGNGEIDEPTEASLERPFQQQPMSITGTVRNDSLQLDLTQGATNFDDQVAVGVVTGLESRQLFARHLYCLAQLIVPDDYAFPNLEPEYCKTLLANRRNSQAAFKKYLEVRARILAQWAVNVVDFRDADSAMTRFPYDPDPLDKLTQQFDDVSNVAPGWNLHRWTSSEPAPVAWGMEQPELLLTESLAFHDLRVRGFVTGTNKKRFDQFRMPEGSLFLELYNPRTTLQGTTAVDSAQFPGVSGALYSKIAGGDIALNLSKLSVDGQHPLWRIYVSEGIDKSKGGTHKTPNQRMLNAPVSTESRYDLTYQLPTSNRPNGAAITPYGSHGSGLVFDHTGLIRDSRPDPASNPRADDDTQRLPEPDAAKARVVVFVPDSVFEPIKANTPGVTLPDAQVFVNQSTTEMFLRGNQYLVVGPRQISRLGSLAGAKKMPPVNRPSNHRIQLTATWPAMFAEDGSPSGMQFRRFGPGQPVRAAVTMIAAASRPVGWAKPETNGFRVGISVSEPLASSYYREPSTPVNTDTSPSVGFQNVFDGYHDYRTSTTPALAPFDDGSSGPLAVWSSNSTGYGGGQPPSGGNNSHPLTVKDIGNDPPVPVVEPGTAVDWCTAYLQRLADPSKPWNEVHNPYMTVDWIPIDLTVFSGEDDDNDLAPATGQTLRLASRQKAGQMINSKSHVFDPNPATAQGGESHFSSLTHAPRKASPGYAGGSDADKHTMLKFSIAGDAGAALNPRPSKTEPGSSPEFFANSTTELSFATLGFLNSPFVLAAEHGISSGLPPTYSAPLGPFFGGPSDPRKTSPNWFPASLFWANRDFVNSMELAYVPLSSPGQIGQEFSATRPAAPPLEPYGPAFHNGGGAMPTASSGTLNPNAGYKFAHLLNFFQEMPEVAGTFANTPNPKDASLTKLFELVETRSPWVDVQSVQSPDLGYSHAVLRPFRPPYNTLPREAEPGRINLNTISEPNVLKGLYAQLLNWDDRKNESVSTDDVWKLFETSRRGYATEGPNPDYPTQFAGVFKPTAEAGMVPQTRNGKLDEHSKKNPVQSTIWRQHPVTANSPPLFSYRPALTANDLPQPHVLHDILPISRLQKLVTERSNVFAVYTTVGLFEYDPSTGNIGREYGLDNGQNRRLKAFYVIDRSVPVGYRIGEDHNIDKTILVRRILAE